LGVSCLLFSRQIPLALASLPALSYIPSLLLLGVAGWASFHLSNHNPLPSLPPPGEVRSFMCRNRTPFSFPHFLFFLFFSPAIPDSAVASIVHVEEKTPRGRSLRSSPWCWSPSSPCQFCAIFSSPLTSIPSTQTLRSSHTVS